MPSTPTALALVLLLALPSQARAQCTEDTQRLIDARKLDVARTRTEGRLLQAPQDDAAMDCLARILVEEGDPRAAVAQLEKAIATNGSNARHHQAQASALMSLAQKTNFFGRLKIASRLKAELERAVALDSTLVDPRVLLVSFYLQAPGPLGGSRLKAREQVAALERLNPLRGRLGEAALAEDAKDYPAAERTYLAAIAASPDSDAAYAAAGGFYQRRERWSDAVAMYEKQLRVLPSSAALSRRSNAHMSLGTALRGSGQRERAKGALETALTLNPENEAAKKALAELR